MHQARDFIRAARADLPNKPFEDLLEPNCTYKYGEKSGCGKPPEWVQKARERNTSYQTFTPLSKYYRPPSADDPGYNGFCEIGWTACPDAAKNNDYYYYAKALGPKWVTGTVAGIPIGDADKYYCFFNGWLEPEIAVLTRNFT